MLPRTLPFRLAAGAYTMARNRAPTPAPILAAIWTVLALAASAPAAAEQVLVAFGDSLVAGYGLPAEDGFSAVLQRRLRDEGLTVRVENAGLSGDTSAGGLSRLDWALASGADLVIVELGANDMLRGIEPAVTRANLDAILARLGDRGFPVLLVGMRAPANLGRDYVDAFDAIYPELAAAHGVAFYPFFLQGVALQSELNQADGIHPNAEGVKVIVEAMLPLVTRVLESR
jgi:acyl-CoA thioesterase I